LLLTAIFFRVKILPKEKEAEMTGKNLISYFVVSLVFLSLTVSNTSAEQAGQTAAPEAKTVSLQNFEPNNGTEGECFYGIWQVEPELVKDNVHAGNSSLMVGANDQYGGTVGINFASKEDHIDFSKAKKVSIWIYDKIGDNAIQIRLRDTEGNGGSGDDKNFLWSTKRTKKDNWTQIKWNLNQYPKFS